IRAAVRTWQALLNLRSEEGDQDRLVLLSRLGTRHSRQSVLVVVFRRDERQRVSASGWPHRLPVQGGRVVGQLLRGAEFQDRPRHLLVYRRRSEGQSSEL